MLQAGVAQHPSSPEPFQMHYLPHSRAMSCCLDDDPETLSYSLAVCLLPPAGPADGPSAGALRQAGQRAKASYLKLPDLERCSVSDTAFHLFSLVICDI